MRKDRVFSLILGPDIHRDLRGTQIFIWLNPRKYPILFMCNTEVEWKTQLM
jgi:hypothetical protein